MAIQTAVVLRDGREVELRPLDPGDRERLRRLFHRLSPESVYRRFGSPIHEPSETGLSRLLDLDHRDREALAAVYGDEVAGVCRYFRAADGSSADIAVLVEDAWQGRGLSLILIEHLRRIALARGIERFTATILSQNRPAIAMVRRSFPNAEFELDGTELRATMSIAE